MTKSDKPVLLRAAEIQARSVTFSHPWNPNSELHWVRLGRETGLQRTGVNIARMPPGKESFVYHSHRTEEEWIYILSGRGIAEIDDKEYEVGPGDFLGFPAPSVAHHLRNPFDQDLVYLVGGESHELEVGDYPRLGKRVVRHGNAVRVYPLEAGESMPIPGREDL